MNLPKRKQIRLKGYDYSTPGAYFITICTKNKEKLLSKITTGDNQIERQNTVTEIGEVCDKYINNINIKYDNVTVNKYVIMPNHIHLIIFIGVTMRASSPTVSIENVVRSLKIMTTKEIGKSIWQRSYHDHIIRGEIDYRQIWEYIDSNPEKWEFDCFYVK